LGANEEVTEGTHGMGVGRIGEVGDRTSKGQAAGCKGQVLQRGLWQGKEPGIGQGVQGMRLVLTRS
jgi:hypothetical protein